MERQSQGSFQHVFSTSQHRIYTNKCIFIEQSSESLHCPIFCKGFRKGYLFFGTSSSIGVFGPGTGTLPKQFTQVTTRLWGIRSKKWLMLGEFFLPRSFDFQCCYIESLTETTGTGYTTIENSGCLLSLSMNTEGIILLFYLMADIAHFIMLTL